MSYSEETTIDGFPATQGARIGADPSHIVDGEALGYPVTGYANLHRLPVEGSEVGLEVDGVSRALVNFDSLDTSEETLRSAATAAAFALQSLRMAAQRRNQTEPVTESI